MISDSAGKIRANQIKKIIVDENPDILCLQEVDSIYDWFNGELEKKYTVFWEKYNSAKGKLIAFKPERFQEINRIRFNYDSYLKDFEESLIKEDINKFKDFWTAQMIKLKDLITKKEFWVINTHLQSNPRLDDIKYYQWGVILNSIVKNCSNLNNENKLENDLVLFMGDFNSMPTSNSLRLTKGLEPKYENLELSFLNKPDNTLKNEEGIFKCVNHKKINTFKLTNCYENYWEEGFPEFTNFTKGFKETIDYMFYGKGFKIIERKKIPTLNQLKNFCVESIPNETYPSDHFPLGCVFDFC